MFLEESDRELIKIVRGAGMRIAEIPLSETNLGLIDDSPFSRAAAGGLALPTDEVQLGRGCTTRSWAGRDQIPDPTVRDLVPTVRDSGR